MREGDILAASHRMSCSGAPGRDMGEAFLKLIEEGRSSEAPGRVTPRIVGATALRVLEQLQRLAHAGDDHRSPAS